MTVRRAQSSRSGVVCVSPDLRPGVESILQGLADQNVLEQFVTTLGIAPAVGDGDEHDR